MQAEISGEAGSPDDIPIQIPFVTVCDGNFTVCSQAADHMKRIRGPISICSVFGLPKSGKTTLIERSIFSKHAKSKTDQGLEEFFSPCSGQGGGSRAPCNVAIWMWVKSMCTVKSDGSQTSVIFLESGEGEGDWQKEANRIFALIVLLSSHVLYNGEALLDDSKLGNLDTIRNLTRYIRTKIGGHEEEDGVTFHEFFPQITFIVRNCDSEGLDSAKEEQILSIKSRNYLMSKLRVTGFSELADRKNTVRKMIASFFPQRHCFLLPTPSKNSEVLKDVRGMLDQKLDKSFVSQLSLLRKFIESHAHDKALIDIPLSGTLFIYVAEIYIRYLNQNCVPSIPAAWTELNERKCRIALDAAIDRYCLAFKELSSQLPCGDEVLNLRHFQHAERSRYLFNQNSFESPRKLQEKFREILEDHLMFAFKSLATRNFQLSHQAAKIVLDRLYESIHSRLEEIQSLPEYEVQRTNLRHQFAILTADLSQQSCQILLAEYLDNKLLMFTQELLFRSTLSCHSGSRAGSICSSAPAISPPYSPRFQDPASKGISHDFEGRAILPIKSNAVKELFKAVDGPRHSPAESIEECGEHKHHLKNQISSTSQSVQTLWEAIGTLSRETEIEQQSLTRNSFQSRISEDDIRSSSEFSNCARLSSLDESRAREVWLEPCANDSIKERKIDDFENPSYFSSAIILSSNLSDNPASKHALKSWGHPQDRGPRFDELPSNAQPPSDLTKERNRERSAPPTDFEQQPCFCTSSLSPREYSKHSTVSEYQGTKQSTQVCSSSSVSSDKNPNRENSPDCENSRSEEMSKRTPATSAGHSTSEDSFSQNSDATQHDSSCEVTEQTVRLENCRRGLQMMRKEMEHSLKAIDSKIQREMRTSIDYIRAEISDIQSRVETLLLHESHQTNEGLSDEEEVFVGSFVPDRLIARYGGTFAHSEQNAFEPSCIQLPQPASPQPALLEFYGRVNEESVSQNMDIDEAASVEEQVKLLRSEIKLREKLIEQMQLTLDCSIVFEIENEGGESLYDTQFHSEAASGNSVFFLYDVCGLISSLSLEVQCGEQRHEGVSPLQNVVKITAMEIGGVAQRSGLLRNGDILTAVDGISINSADDPLEKLSELLSSSISQPMPRGLLTLTFQRLPGNTFSISGPRTHFAAEQFPLKREQRPETSPGFSIFNISPEKICASLSAFVPEIRSFNF